MLPWSQRRQRTTWQRHKAQVNRRAAFLIATTDENGVDPHRNPHDTVHMGHARHGLGGAAPVVSRQANGAGAASFSEDRVYPRRSPGKPTAIATTSPPSRRRKSPRDGGRGLQSGYALLPSPAPVTIPASPVSPCLSRPTKTRDSIKYARFLTVAYTTRSILATTSRTFY